MKKRVIPCHLVCGADGAFEVITVNPCFFDCLFPRRFSGHGNTPENALADLREKIGEHGALSLV